MLSRLCLTLLLLAAPPLDGQSVAPPPESETTEDGLLIGLELGDEVGNGSAVATLPSANTLDAILDADPVEVPNVTASPIRPFTRRLSKLYFGEVDPTTACNCTDDVPADAFSCQELRFDERCEAEAVVEGGKCEITCDRCDCCPSLMEMATRRGLDSFRKAAEYLAEIEGSRSIATALRNPSFEGTVFIPTNDAFARLQYFLNLTHNALFTRPNLLTQIVSYHVLLGSSVKFRDDLVRGEASLLTQNAAAFLAVNETNGAVAVQGVGSRSHLLVPDLHACRSLIHVVDEVLLPFSTAGLWE